MAVPDNEDRPTIERVTTGRRGPLAVVALAAVIVGVLLWKPWDRPSPTASLGPFAVVPSPTLMNSPSPSPLPTPSPSATPSPPPIIFPTPGPTAAAVEIDVGPGRGRAFVECEYQPVADGARVLARLRVAPPIVQLNPEAAAQDVRRVAWRAEIQVNLLETIFSADWEPLDKSLRQFALDLTSEPLAFSQLSIAYDKLPVGPTFVVRVVVVVEWFGPRRALLGSREIVPTTYGIGDSGAVLSEGCHTFLS